MELRTLAISALLVITSPILGEVFYVDVNSLLIDGEFSQGVRQ
jgi:hypothetical protein